MPGLWSKKWIPVKFSLVGDAIGVKYAVKQNVEHLIQTIQENYQV